MELTPEGTGYRAKTRFAKFYNLPELMAMFKEIADIKTADMLNLPVPEAKYHNIAVKPSEMQKEMVIPCRESRAVRGGGVDSSVDNMLKITNDGRKLALDQRMLNDMLPDFEGSKSMPASITSIGYGKKMPTRNQHSLCFVTFPRRRMMAHFPSITTSERS